MAFFGEDGLQRQLKQAQRDLMAKGKSHGQIASMHLVTKEKDETIKKLRSEVERVREEKEDLMTSGASGSGKTDEQSAAEKIRLRAELKEAQDALNRSNMDLMRLREEARQNSIQLHNDRIAKSSSSSAMSNASGSSRRRSTSLSSDPRVKDLEAELTRMREAAGSPAAEIDGLKTQLTNVKRDLNKAINERMALEARARKDVEAVQGQLDDANFELDALRRDMDDGGNSVSKKEVDRQRRAWDGEKQELQAKIVKLEGTAKDHEEEIGRLRSAADEVDRLNSLLADERAKPKSVPAPASPVNHAEVDRLTDEVATLRLDLAQARSQAAGHSAPSAPSDLSVRRLQRQLEKAQRDIEALEQSLDQSEEENQALRSRVPLPGSPGLKADDGRVMALEADNDELRAEIHQLRETLAAAQTELDTMRSARDQLETVQAELEGLKLEVEQSGIALRAADVEKETVLARLASTQTSLADTQRTVAELETQVQTAQRQLDDTTTDLSSRSQRIEELGIELDAAQRSAKQSSAQEEATKERLSDAERTIAELQGRPNTESLAAELSQAQVEVERLGSQTAELEAIIAKANKEKDDMVDVASRLTLEKDDLMSRLAGSQEQLEEVTSSLAVAQSRVQRGDQKAAELERQLEKVAEELDAAVRDRTAIEHKLSQAQDTLADRSTESEADRRDTEIVQLRADLDVAKAALSDKEAELEREVQLLTFTKEQDTKAANTRMAKLQHELEAARSKKGETESALRQNIANLEKDAQLGQQRIENLMQEVSTLQAKLASTPSPRKAQASSTPDRVGLLYAKIQSLRAERDELRQSLSFAQNESRFTISAAQADRQSALDELERVKRDIMTQLAVHEALENDVESVRAQLAEREVKLEETKALYAGVTVDRGDVDDKIAQFERDAVVAKAKQSELVKQIEESQTIIVELNHAMALMRSNTETDKRHRRISMDRKTEMSVINETSFGIAPTHERSLSSSSTSRRPGHTRTRSEMASLILPDQAQISSLTGKVAELEAEVKTLSGKLERRNAALAIASRENEKLKMAQELNREAAEDFEELVAERDTLQATVEQRTAEMEALKDEVSGSKAALAAQVDKLQSVESAMLASRVETATFTETIAAQTSRIETLETDLQVATEQSATANKRADSLHLDVHASERQTADLVLEILVQRKRLAHATRAWRHASAGLRHQTAALASSAEQINTLTTQIGAFEAERDVMAQQLESYTQRGRALDAANEKVHDLESQLETLQAECIAMAEQLDLQVASSGDEHKAQLEQARLRMEAVSTELADANARAAQLCTELGTVKSDLSASESSRTALENQLDAQQRAAVDAANAAKAKLDDVESSAQRATAENHTLSARVEEIAHERDGLNTTVLELQAKLDEASSSSTDRTLALQSTNADLQRRVDESVTKVEHLRIEVSSLMTKNQLLSTEMAEIKVELDTSRQQLSTEQEIRQQLDEKVAELIKGVEAHDVAMQDRDLQVKELSDKLATLETALSAARDDATSAKTSLEQQINDLEAMRLDNAELQRKLSAAKETPSDSTVVNDLKERIEELEKSLLAKTEEVDEADDRTREAYKAKIKLEKKVAKLTRQMADKELEANTKRNKVIPLEPASAPTPIPVAEAAVPAAPAMPVAPNSHQRTPSGRAPLRPVARVDATSQVPVAAAAATPTTLKRTRDVEADEKPLPAEAIMLPPTAPVSLTKKPLARTSFTPKRNITAGTLVGNGASANKNQPGSAGNNDSRGNIFAPRP